MRICLVANFAYGALTGEETGHIGGVERQAALFSEWLSQNGHDVSVITWDEGDVSRVGDVKIIKLCKQDEGVPGLRFIYPRWSSLIAALRIADADVYYQNCAEYVTGQVALWCRRNNRPFVYSIASDADCDYDLPNLEHWRAKALFRYGLRNADLVVAQTYNQVELLDRNFDVKAQVIRMPGTPPVKNSKYSDESRFQQKKVVWVARVAPVKRIGWIIDIARSLPDISFEIIGPLDESQADGVLIRRQLEETPNINFAGKVKRSEMPDRYQQASLLCCTSIYEGFPNTYLEAWSYGVPVVTTIDPDGLIMSHSMGFSSDSKSELKQAIERILGDETAWKEMATNAKKYYLQNHQLDPIQRQFEYQLNRLDVFGATLDHFEKESQQWSDYYLHQPNSLSHLDVQARLQHVSEFMRSNNEAKKDYLEETNILDLGCGTGDAINILPNEDGVSIISADYSLGMVKRTMSQFATARGAVANALTLPFSDKQFSYVLSLGVYEYIEEFNLALAESRRVLADDGELILSVPNKLSIFRKLRVVEMMIVRPVKLITQLFFNARPSEKYYHRQWTPDCIQRALKTYGFEVLEMQHCSYGLLSPKLTSAKFNLALCRFLNSKLDSHQFLQRHLAHTTVIHAKKNDSLLPGTSGI